MNKILSVLAHEIREIIPATIFFLVTLHLLVLTKSLLLEGYDLTPTSSFVATIGALIVAKAILIADKLPIVNIFSNRALIYDLVWRTLIYLLIVALFRFAEEVIPLHTKYGDWSSAAKHLTEEISWPLFWVTQMWLTILLFFYCSTVKLIREIGAGNIKDIFFSADKNNTGA